MNLQQKWENVLETLREDFSTTVYEAWFEPLQALSIDETQHILYLGCHRDYILKSIQDRYLSSLTGAVKYVFQEEYKIILKLIEEEPVAPVKNGLQRTPTEDDPGEEYYLNPRFSFDSFVVGKNNEFAYSAALAVAESPANVYNPLFLYGSSGLGKTHLMHAIGHYILKNYDNKKVLYVSSEMFTNELINALRNKEVGPFKRKYRDIDVLLIDDIQFIEGKESTQEEFFHTFNSLYDRNRQIVISSDRPPQKLTSLDNRLTSRFLWSVTADIQPPDYETRVAILMNKASRENIEITGDIMDVISLIASKIKLNVRVLEGAFTRVISFSTIMKKPITKKLAKEVLSDMLSQSDMKITVETIKKCVAKYYDITIKDMDSSKRSRSYSHPRQVAMYLSKELTDNSLPKIGKAFGGKDHTTVLHAYKKVQKDILYNEELADTIEELVKIINEN